MEVFDKCEKCGGDIEYRQTDSVQGWFCKNCDWSIVATCVPELDEDTYCIYVLGVNYMDSKHISAISRACGKNYLALSRLLQQEKPKVLEGDASQILKAKSILESAGLNPIIC